MNFIAQRAALAPHWVWVIYTCACMPAVILSALLQTLWESFFETLWDGLRGLSATWAISVIPMWLSIPSMFTRRTHRYARQRAIDIRRGYLKWPGFNVHPAHTTNA